MYEALIGDRIKELVMIKMVMQNTENYILKVGEKSDREIEPNPILLELANKIRRCSCSFCTVVLG